MIDLSLKKSNILIVDDQLANIDVLEGLLEMQGYTNIRTTTDSRKVIGLFSDFAPDLILLDLSMPHHTGFEVMEQLKPLIPPSVFFPILVLTADVTPDAKQRALAGGASDFLTKPFDLIEVGLRIKNLLFSSYLLHQSENQNHILEEKVKERTRELEQMNAELIIAKDKAEASDRLKTAFMNNISHEIRTPLNGILGFAPMVIDPSVTVEDKQEFLDILNISSKRLMQTITDFMDISLITSGNMEAGNTVFSPLEVIQEILGNYRPRCVEKNLELVVSNMEALNSAFMHSDRGMLSKILTHLIDNALKFTKEGVITVQVATGNTSLNISIADTGVGIQPDSLSSIFSHFKQEDVSSTRGHEGSGLGLAIVKGLVSLLGGSIVVESVKGLGSKFSISLPGIEQDESEPASEMPPVTGTTRRRPLILVAEDDPFGFLYLELTLNNSYEILRAEDGAEAVELCRMNPEIQLVLMDVKMPNMNGLLATQEIKKTRPDLPIIILSAYAEAGMEDKCMKAGCDLYLSKPINKKDMFSTLAKFGFPPN